MMDAWALLAIGHNSEAQRENHVTGFCFSNNCFFNQKWFLNPAKSHHASFFQNKKLFLVRKRLVEDSRLPDVKMERHQAQKFFAVSTSRINGVLANAQKIHKSPKKTWTKKVK